MVNNEIDKNEDELEEITDEQTDTAEPELQEIEDASKSKLKKLQAKLKQVEEDKRKALESLAVAKADFLNAKRRLEDERARGIERQKVRDMEALLPLCDSFYMAMADKEAWEAADEKWRKGIEGIHAQLQQVLAANDVKAIDPIDTTFDPSLHEAMGTADSDKEPDTIIETLQLGYTMKETIIRHAKVIIST